VPVVENATAMRAVLIVELLYSESNPKGAVFSQPVRFVRTSISWHVLPGVYACMRVCTS
jgi:hypothetical protein